MATTVALTLGLANACGQSPTPTTTAAPATQAPTSETTSRPSTSTSTTATKATTTTTTTAARPAPTLSQPPTTRPPTPTTRAADEWTTLDCVADPPGSPYSFTSLLDEVAIRRDGPNYLVRFKLRGGFGGGPPLTVGPNVLTQVWAVSLEATEPQIGQPQAARAFVQFVSNGPMDERTALAVDPTGAEVPLDPPKVESRSLTISIPEILISDIVSGGSFWFGGSSLQSETPVGGSRGPVEVIDRCSPNASDPSQPGYARYG